MIVKPSDTVSVQFTTQAPTTGAAANADSLPTGVLVRNGDDTAEAVTVSNIATGVYKASVTIPAGYSAGDEVQLRIAATVAAVAGKAVIWSAEVDTARESETYARIGSNGAGLTALGDARLNNLDAAISSRSTLAAGAQMDLVNAPNATALTTIATAVWASATRTLTGFGTLVADIWAHVTRTLTSGGGVTAQQVWEYGTRTLSQIAAVVSPALTASDITMRRGDTFVQTFTVPTHANFSRLWFTVKRHKTAPDADSVFQVVLTDPADAGDGLAVLNGAAAADQTLGSITFAGDTDLTVTLDEAVTALLDTPATAQRLLFYDIQSRIGGVTATVAEGRVFVPEDVTRATA